MPYKFSLLLVFTLLFLSYDSVAQIYTTAKTQHRFAQSYIGFNTQIMPAGGRLSLANQDQQIPSIILPRFTIGGLHFWGKWDFNMNFPLARFRQERLDENHDVDFNIGGDLSARYYPWRLKYGKPRPFVGISFNETTLKLKHRSLGSREDYFLTTSFLLGCAFAKNDWQVNLEMMWMPQAERDFFVSPTEKQRITFPNTYFSLGIIRYFEGTLREEKGMQSGKTQAQAQKLQTEGKLNSFSIGIAPSGAYFLHAPSYQATHRLSVPRHKSNFTWEFGLGYFFHQSNTHIGLSYRSYTSNVGSFGVEQVMKRESIALEGIKFFWNYKGFVPFIGPSISFERWALGEFINDQQLGNTKQSRMFSPGILFGWDIVASPLETWVLRTNLRYYPFQKINDLNGGRTRVDQFEFNFIQLVLYPNRMKNIKR